MPAGRRWAPVLGAQAGLYVPVAVAVAAEAGVRVRLARHWDLDVGVVGGVAARGLVASSGITVTRGW